MVVDRAAPAADLAPLPSPLPAVERRAVLPDGFAAGATTAGIKASGRPDLALIAVAPGSGPASAAAVFTRNAFAAAPVRLSRDHLAATEPAGAGGYGRARGVVSTSGCANAATGPLGEVDQLQVARATASAIGAPVEEVLCLSTGLIGTRLPVEQVAEALGRLTAMPLRPTDAGLAAAAEALCTTDSRVKVATATVTLPDPDGMAVRPVRVTGIAKGVGMIHPGMATMLAVLLTDAQVEPAALHAILRHAAVRTWNQLTVDGDTSTNDTVFLLASGAADTEAVSPRSAAAATLGAAVEAVARDLARQQAADGEGATTLLTCQVSGGRDDAEARAVARAVVASSLVKAAIHGRDPNWGRVAGAAGNARLPDAEVLEAAGLPPAEADRRGGRPVRVNPDTLRIAIAGQLVFDGAEGGPVAFDRDAARAVMDAAEVVIRLDLGEGEGTGEAFGCDLTEAYVRENSEYST